MPKPIRKRPRAPIDEYGRTVAAGRGSRPRFVRIALSAAARSGAVSAKVPSKSNSAALLVTQAAQEIVDVAVRFQPIALAERVVGHADQLRGAQARIAREARELGGLDEALVVVRSLGQQPQDVFGADYGEEIRLR